jgi:predicted Fe-S protein YdhL (DUF1289 family)
MNAAISPCVGICRLDDATGYCIGCGRTGDEIATWSTAGPGGRRAIWAALPARLDVLGVAVRRRCRSPSPGWARRPTPPRPCPKASSPPPFSSRNLYRL